MQSYQIVFIEVQKELPNLGKKDPQEFFWNLKQQEPLRFERLYYDTNGHTPYSETVSDIMSDLYMAGLYFAENQPPYLPLPALRDVSSDNGEVITCWKLSFIERLKVLFSGCIWVSIATFNKPIMPIFITTQKSDVI
jgi:hypothetical protein